MKTIFLVVAYLLLLSGVGLFLFAQRVVGMFPLRPNLICIALAMASLGLGFWLKNRRVELSSMFMVLFFLAWCVLA